MNTIITTVHRKNENTVKINIGEKFYLLNVYKIVYILKMVMRTSDIEKVRI